jgi:hypothetical protein
MQVGPQASHQLNQALTRGERKGEREWEKFKSKLIACIIRVNYKFFTSKAFINCLNAKLY